MKLSERLNVLIQATSLSQKSGILTLDDAVKAKTAIDIISSGTLNQNYPSAINTLIEIAVTSQKKGVYSLKDAYMIYLAIEGIESELQNEANRMNEEIKKTQVSNKKENVVTIAPKILKKNSLK
jgi:flagellar motor component MotA